LKAIATAAKTHKFLCSFRLINNAELKIQDKRPYELAGFIWINEIKRYYFLGRTTLLIIPPSSYVIINTNQFGLIQGEAFL
jgi:hypothetical protein